MRRAAEMGTLDAWYDHIDIDEVLGLGPRRGR